jgi:hypothetical protein
MRVFDGAFANSATEQDYAVLVLSSFAGRGINQKMMPYTCQRFGVARSRRA